MLTSRDFQQVFKLGVRQRRGRFIFICSKNKLPFARLGLAIAKKTIPLAVDRNRLRRLIREGFRHYQEQLAGLDVVVMMEQGVRIVKDSTDHEDLCHQWIKLVNIQSKSC